MLEPFSVPFVDVTGKVRRIRSLALCDRRWFLNLRNAALELISDQDFRVLYDDPNSHFRALVDECLLLCKINPAWVDAYSATRLLFGMGDEESILMALNFPEPPQEEKPSRKDKPLPANIDGEAYGIAALWGATESLEQALTVASRHPWLEVQAILQARSHLLRQGTEDQKKEERIEESTSALERMQTDGRMEDFLSAIRNRDSDRGNAVGVEQLPDDYLS